MIYPQWHGKRIRLQVNTTHPAMLELFKTLFSKYSHLCLCPDFRKKLSTFQWHIQADLDASFSFLMKKPRAIEVGIIKNTNLFLAFLAGYADAEGSFIIVILPTASRLSSGYVLKTSEYSRGFSKNCWKWITIPPWS